jgi:biopolymer transport protein ExbD
MGMNVGNSAGGDADPSEMVDINTTPLIDVMLVLLIMLIITIPVQKHAVKLDMPVDQNAPPPPENPIAPISLEVDFDGTLYWDGVIVNGASDLQQRLQQLAQADPQPEFHIRPNRLAAYEHVIAVMAQAQRLGITKMGVIQNS